MNSKGNKRVNLTEVVDRNKQLDEEKEKKNKEKITSLLKEVK